MSRSELVNQQLQSALNTRVIIEQAKGVLAERGSVDMDRAFELLRSHARRTHQRLADVALAVVQNADTTAILNPDGR
jgi:AmiR/NasT family two-component response regulator